MVRLPYLTSLTSLFTYALLLAFGHLRDFFRRFLDSRKPGNLKVRSSILAGQRYYANFFWAWRCGEIAADDYSVGLRAHLLWVRGVLHASLLPPHPSETPFLLGIRIIYTHSSSFKLSWEYNIVHSTRTCNWQLFFLIRGSMSFSVTCFSSLPGTCHCFWHSIYCTE